MQRNVPVATDHQLILQGLEVLRLMADHMEMDNFVESEDVATVLGFLGDVGCECLKHTEQLLLRPALERAKQQEHIQRFGAAVALHATVRPLFENTSTNVALRKEFVVHVNHFTKLLSDLIFDEDQFLLQAAVDLLDDPEGRLSVDEFVEQERRIRAVAVRGGPELHRLETKYVHPHCI